MFKNKFLTATIGLAISFFPLSALTQDTLAQNSLPNDSSKNYVGFAVEDDDGNFQIVSKLNLANTQNCPDKAPKQQEVAFISDNTPTAGDRRVIITNITKNVVGSSVFDNAGEIPYTDRQYEQDRISEDIEVAIGAEHIDEKFVVSPGTNLLQYEIVEIREENGQEIEEVLETGKFSIDIETTNSSAGLFGYPDSTPVSPNFSSYCSIVEAQEKHRLEQIEHQLQQDFNDREWERQREREREIIEDFKKSQPPIPPIQYKPKNWQDTPY